MKKTISYLLIIFFILSVFSSVAGAQASPPADPSFVSFAEVQQQLLNAQSRLAQLQARFNEPKMSLTEAEMNALQNMQAGSFFAVGFKLPPTFDGQQLNWSSSNPSVASIAALGSRSLVLANNPGKAVITVSSADGRFKYSFTVVVY